MTTSRKRVRRPPRPAPTFAEQSVALAWGAWVELGVSGWGETHGDWAIDPEPLIIFTAFLEGEDPRLQDEALDWCIRNWRSVSKTRLKGLLREQSPDVRELFGEFAATVGIHAGVTWPGETDARDYTVTGKSAAPELDKASLVWLRLRAMFGVSARCEILRYFLSGEGGRSSVATIAAATNYTKRNIAEECETLERAGVLAVRSMGNRFYYSLARPQELQEFVGTMPDVRPDWSVILTIARELVLLERRAETSTAKAMGVKVRMVIDRLEDAFDALEIDLPTSDVRGEQLWPAVQAIGVETLGEWSMGRWHHPRGEQAVPARQVRRLPAAQ